MDARMSGEGRWSKRSTFANKFSCTHDKELATTEEYSYADETISKLVWKSHWLCDNTTWLLEQEQIDIPHLRAFTIGTTVIETVPWQLALQLLLSQNCAIW